jgi:selenide, water dikinase
LPPGDLEEILRDLPVQSHPDLLVGWEKSDDAGVIRVREDLALIQTVDFFTPIVNDPRDFGRIAAANALSDVYAMGGKPLTAMNLVCFPRDRLPKTVLKEILLGGMEVIHQAGALLVGGHSVSDPELKYGLSVMGMVHPDRVVTNAGARLGDRLILTKPLGTGILATAIKGRMLSAEAELEAIRWMSALNRHAAEAMMEVGAHACTDVTGFGFLGHALEMAKASRVQLRVWASRVPVLPSALLMARKGMVPGGTFANREYCSRSVIVDAGVDPILVDCLADAQTSGGLLIAVPGENSAALHEALERRGVPHPEVGEILDDDEGRIQLLP